MCSSTHTARSRWFGSAARLSTPARTSPRLPAATRGQCSSRTRGCRLDVPGRETPDLSGSTGRWRHDSVASRTPLRPSTAFSSRPCWRRCDGSAGRRSTRRQRARAQSQDQPRPKPLRAARRTREDHSRDLPPSVPGGAARRGRAVRRTRAGGSGCRCKGRAQRHSWTSRRRSGPHAGVRVAQQERRLRVGSGPRSVR